MKEVLTDVFRFLHVISFVFMSVPLFNLIIVNERARLGGWNYNVDRYLENVISGQSKRCYVFQLTVLISGIVLIYLNGIGLGALITNWVLGIKLLLLLTLSTLLSVVHFGIQPKIEGIIAQATPDRPLSDEMITKLKSTRMRRKRLAGLCLFLVITTIILGMQVFTRYNPILTLVLIALSVIFARRAFKGLVPYGWV